MSHFTRVKTVIRELAPLEKALQEVLGWETVRNGVVRGYNGNTEKADLVAVNPVKAYDIGYEKRAGQETYEMVADPFGFHNSPINYGELPGAVAQRYALNILREESERLGFDFTEPVEAEDGALTISLSRW